MVSRQLFVKKYIDSLNAFEAAESLGICLFQTPQRYYVYFLLHPATGKIFYIGKGKGNRKEVHLKEYYNSQVTNHRKYNSISKIVKSVVEPLAVIFENDLDEQEAYEIESFFIHYFMDYGISNHVRGQIVSLEHSKEIGKDFLFKVIDFDRWCDIKPRSVYEKELFWLVKNGLEETSENGNITKIITVTNDKGSTLRYEYS